MNSGRRGELLTLQQLAEKADTSEATIKRILQAGYLDSKKIGRSRFVYYRDFLRAAWEYEQNKLPKGRKKVVG